MRSRCTVLFCILLFAGGALPSETIQQVTRNIGTTQRSVKYNLTIIDEQDEQNPHESTEVEAEKINNITWLTPLHLLTKTGAHIDISLSKKYKEEKCTIESPAMEIKALEEVDLNGVTIQNASAFVSCRITVGPMEPSLLGKWTICGEHTEDNEDRTRCQVVTIDWYRNDIPDSSWHVNNITKFDHVVNYNGILTPTVKDIGTVRSCHIVTPDGEDLAVTDDSGYPKLSLVNDSTQCSIAMGPIDNTFLGDWTLYGMFQSSFETYQVSFPMRLSLYDKSNPYNQAYNISVMEMAKHVVNLGNTINIDVDDNGATEKCEAIHPSGQTYNQGDSKEGVEVTHSEVNAACHVAIGPITEAMLGDWVIIGKFQNRDNFIEKQLPVNIIKEDPDNPIIDEDRIIETRELIFLNTSIGASHTVAIPAIVIHPVESCHLRTPEGRQYTLMEGFNITGIEITIGPDNACGVTVNVLSEELIGDWVLITRESRLRELHEIRLPFTIYVEEKVNVSPDSLTIREGNDLYVRLEEPTVLFETCKLFKPNGNESTDHEINAAYLTTCGFIVRNVSISDSGNWEIRYGSGITYRGIININVTALWLHTETTYTWALGGSVDELIGPENPVYCRIEDSSKRVVFEGFSTCHIRVDSVTTAMAGVWTMTLGTTGQIIPEEHLFNVEVITPEHKPLVTTQVNEQDPVVTLTCSVPVDYDVRSCTFRDPHGNILIASQGVGESRYVFYGSGTEVTSEVKTHECGLHISNPLSEEIGLWRCAVATENDVYYGFLNVTSSWVNDTVDSRLITPTLSAVPDLSSPQDIDATLFCSIQSPIRYCYFRHPNGTIFNISPVLSSGDMEYVGAGFDAGECGIRVPRVTVNGGQWSCHVGLPDLNKHEQRASILLNIQKDITVSQIYEPRTLTLRGQVNNSLEYCRYVRNYDGLGFTSALLPYPNSYYTRDNLTRGYCELNIIDPIRAEVEYSWTIVAKIINRDDEVFGVTTPTIRPVFKSYAYLWILIIISGFVMISFGIMFIPHENRRRTLTRVSSWRTKTYPIKTPL